MFALTLRFPKQNEHIKKQEIQRAMTMTGIESPLGWVADGGLMIQSADRTEHTAAPAGVSLPENEHFGTHPLRCRMMC